MTSASIPLAFETWPIDRLIEYARNPRKNDHAVDRVAAAIREFGFRVPIVAKSDGLVVDGHLRLKAAKKLGLAEVPVILADDMTDAQVKAFRLSVNKVAELAEWDDELLGLEFDDLREMGFDLTPIGFDPDEIAALTASTVKEGLTDDDAVPEAPEVPITREGDVWLLGRHRLMCGDSTSVDAVERLMAGRDWDVCVFDPPYEVESLYRDAMPPAATGKKLAVMWDFKRFATAPAAALAAGWLPLYEFIWDCVQSWYTPNRPLARHKSIGIFGDDPFFDTDKSTIADGKKREAKTVSNTRGKCEYVPLDGAKHIATVESFPNTAQNDSHGHGKPVDWIAAIFNGIAGDTYLDLFGGSGSTLIACEKTGRDCRMMELDPRYCDVIIKRWQDYTGQQATLEATGETYDQLKTHREAA
jgi:DNA modification methylase